MKHGSLLLYAVCLMLIGLTFTTNVPLVRSQVIFTLGTNQDLTAAFNPLTGWFYGLYKGVLYCSLYRLMPDFSMVPYVAQSAVQVDPHTWQVKLRPDVLWHDGTHMTAYDWNFTIMNLLKYPTSATRFLSGVEGVNVIDNLTFQVKTQYPIPYATWLIDVYPVPQHVWEAANATGANILTYKNIPAVGCGPFEYVNSVPGQSAEFQAFDQFFLGRPKIDRLIVQVFSTTEAEIAAFKAGELDGIGLPVPYVSASALKSENIPSVYVAGVGAPNTIGIWFNLNKNGTQNKALLDINVRRALETALNKTYLNQLVHPSSTVALSILPQLFQAYYDNEDLNLVPQFNLTKANQILDEAGYKMGSNGIRVAPDGTPLEFRFNLDSVHSEELPAVNVIRGWWSQIGVGVTAKIVESAEAWDIVSSPPYNWDITWSDWSIHDPVSAFYPYTSQAIPTGWSDCGYSNQTYDATYAQLLNSSTVPQMISTVKDLQKQLLQNVVDIQMSYPDFYMVWWANKWTGFVPAPDGVGVYDGNPQEFLNVGPLTNVTTSPTAMPTASTMASNSTAVQSSNTTVSAIAVVVVIVVIAIAAISLRKRTGKKKTT